MYTPAHRAIAIFNLMIFISGWMLSFLSVLQKLNIYNHYSYVGASLNFCLVITVVLSICVCVSSYVVYITNKE